MARLCPLFSGSSGNCYYIGSASSGVLIDAGRSAKQIVNKLSDCNIDIKNIRAVFVTHEHGDHIKGLRVLASRYHMDVYSSVGTLQALQKTGNITSDFRSEIISDEGVSCADMLIKPFHTSHDSAESVGYRVTTADDRSVAVSTDLGYMSDEVRNVLSGTDFIVLESNHDVGMLQNGPYPYPLKRRILSDTGHLSNLACADELYGLSKKGTTRFLLAHLSSENNTPELAYQTALCSLSLAGLKQGEDYILSVAPKENMTGKTILF